MSEQQVKFSASGAVGIITLNSPETRNALTPEMMAALGKAVEQCASPNIRAVLLTGAGGAFCAGANVRQMVETLEESGADGISQAIRELADTLHGQVVLPLRRLPKPVVAGINGVAAGAGFSLTLAADLRVAAQSARFLMAYANIGAPADGGSTFLLPRLLGTGRAMELYLASQPIGAPRALELGLVSQVCPMRNWTATPWRRQHASPLAPPWLTGGSRSCTTAPGDQPSRSNLTPRRRPLPGQPTPAISRRASRPSPTAASPGSRVCRWQI